MRLIRCGLLALVVPPRTLAFSSPSTARRSLTIMSAKSSSDKDSKSRNIVVVGGGIQGTSCAFHLHQSEALPPGSTITILEAQKLASAASGKG